MRLTAIQILIAGLSVAEAGVFRRGSAFDAPAAHGVVKREVADGVVGGGGLGEAGVPGDEDEGRPPRGDRGGGREQQTVTETVRQIITVNAAGANDQTATVTVTVAVGGGSEPEDTDPSREPLDPELNANKFEG